MKALTLWQPPVRRMRTLALSLLLLSACTFELGREGLRVELSAYPTQVAPGTTFEVFVDVLSVEAPLESYMVPPEDLGVQEVVGGSFVVLRVFIPEGAEPGVRTIVIELRSGERTATVELGFTVVRDESGE